VFTVGGNNQLPTEPTQPTNPPTTQPTDQPADQPADQPVDDDNSATGKEFIPVCKLALRDFTCRYSGTHVATTNCTTHHHHCPHFVEELYNIKYEPLFI